MYAISTNGWRSISSESELGAGETMSLMLPPEARLAPRRAEARSRRNSILRNTDWTQVGDNTLTVIERQAWATYRQALRDLPQLPGFPDVEWPQLPVLDPGTAGDGAGAGDL